MSSKVVVKGVVAQSTFDHIKQKHGPDAWDRCIARLSDSDRLTVNAGVNVPLDVMGRFNEALVTEVCGGSRSLAAQEFRDIGAASADKLLLGNGIFSVFARFVSPKQVLKRAETVIKTAYPGSTVEVNISSSEEGGVILIHGMAGFPYGSQRIVGWLLRGIEIVGGTNARVTERNWDAGKIDSETYELTLSWGGWQ
mgnify:CR=1 FL=1